MVQKLKRLFRENFWNIGVVSSPAHSFLEVGFQPKIHWLELENERYFFADPFGIEFKMEKHIFCERFDFNKWKGDIVYLTYKNERFSDHKVVFDFPGHLSYPFLIEENGEIYCMLETAYSEKIELFVATNFPEKWKKKHTIIKGFAGLDNTLFFHNDYWWLFTADLRKNRKSDLHLFYCKSLTGKWQAHFKNPVKSDWMSARPGGTPFYHKGVLYRPAMRNLPEYGSGICINKITRLNPREFSEEKVIDILPFKNEPFNQGFHTLSKFTDNSCLVDGKMKRFVSAAFKSKIKRKLSW